MRRARLRALAFALAPILASACASRPSVSPSGNDRGEDVEAPAATMRGGAVSRAALGDFWFDRHRDAYRRVLDELVDERVAAAEATRRGIEVPAARLSLAVDEEVRARTSQLRATYGDDASLDDVVRRAYGLDVETWKRTVLAPRLRMALLIERVVRLDSRSRPEVRARLIVSHDPAHAASVAAKVRAGADFSLTALRESRDPSAAAGGTLPPIAPGDLALPGVEQRLFAARAGEVVGPLEVVLEGRRQWHVYKVVEREDPWPAGAARARLETDLSRAPVDRAEYERWRERVRRAYDVRLFAPDGTPLPPRVG
jgi:peptidyl-prolyl cis-trans isomerase C